MSSVVNFPPSMNLAQTKAPALEGMRGGHLQFRSQNASYNERETISINIPTGQQGMWLHPQDSYISFRFKPKFTVNNGSVSLDANAYSIFQHCRVRHGSNVLVNQRNCNRLWSALYDVQVPSGERASHTVNLGIKEDSQDARDGYLYGQTLTSDTTYGYSMSLPISVLGSLQEKAIPLGWLNSSQLTLELDLESMTKILTTRTSNNTLQGVAGVNTTANPDLTEGYAITEVIYHAKVSYVEPMYNNMLLQSLGASIVIPAVEYASDEKFIGDGASTINENFSFPFSSMKNFLWWLTSNGTANGTPTTGFNLQSAISQRMSADLKEYMIAFNGQQYGHPINTESVETGFINGATAYQELLRAYNLTSSNSGSVFTKSLYSSNTKILAGDDLTKRFIGALDLDRGDGNNDRFYQGVNTVNDIVTLQTQFKTPLETPCSLFAYAMYDCAYVIEDGLMSTQR